jgi:hydrogenase maturation protein HypF
VRGTVEMRIRGQVQGAGFCSAVWRMAMACRLDGDVHNNGNDVLIRLSGTLAGIDTFRTMLVREPPPPSSIDAIVLNRLDQDVPHGFSIVQGEASKFKIEATPDPLSGKRIVEDELAGKQLPHTG